MTGALRLVDAAAALPKTRAAIEYAQWHHAGQRRSSDGAAFIEHPLEVGQLLYRAGARDRVIAAGLLHDILEKTAVPASELRSRFGSAITALVRAVSEDPRITGYAQRKAALRQQAAAAGREALLIFAADKVSKVRELRRAVAAATERGERIDPALVPPRRLSHLRHCLGLVQERLGDVALVRLLKTELERLEREITGSGRISALA